MQYRQDIDGLRAIAVLLVVFYHLNINIAKNGFIGVDVFFVISGYLITKIIIYESDCGVFSFQRFYFRRIRRIIPSLLLVLLMSSIVGWFVLTPRELHLFGESIVGVSTFTSNLYFYFDADYFSVDNEIKPLIHTWSLAVEEQFYLLYPFFLVFLLKTNFDNVRRAILILMIVSFCLCVAPIKIPKSAVFYFLPFRSWEIFAGCLVALQQKESVSSFRYKTAVGLSIIFVALLLPIDVQVWPNSYSLFPVLGTCLLLYRPHQKDSFANILSTTPVKVIGLASYSIYLIHQPILAFTRIVFNPVSVTVLTVAFTLSVLFGVLIYYSVEKPLKRLTDLKIRTVTVVCMTSLAVFGIYGGLAISTNGFSARIFDDNKFVYGQKQDPIYNCLSEDACSFGETAADINILIYGDSHMGHYVQEIVKRYQEFATIDVIVGGSCFFGSQISRYEKSFDRGDCELKNDNLGKLTSKKYDIIFTSQRWEGYLDQDLTQNDQIASFVRDRVAAKGIPYERMIILGSVPVNVHQCLAENRLWRPPSECDSSDKQSTYDHTELTEIQQNVLFLSPRAILRNQSQKLTPETLYELYHDINHLSNLGAKVVLRPLWKALDDRLSNGAID